MPDKKSPEARTAVGERRSSPRYRTRALTDGSVVASEPGKKNGPSFLGTTVNVSSGGALVRTYEALTAGQQLTLTLHLPEGDLVVSGSVLHVEQDAVGCRLAGIRFTPLEGEASALLAKHLRGFDSGASYATPASGESSASKTRGAPPAPNAPAVPPPAPGEPTPLRKSLRAMREPAPVVFPFEGKIKS